MDMVKMIHEFEDGLGKIVDIKASDGNINIEGEFGIISIGYMLGMVPSDLLLFDMGDKTGIEVSIGAIEEYKISDKTLDTEELVGSVAIINSSEDGNMHLLETGTNCKIIATFETKLNKYAIVDKLRQIVPLGDLTINQKRI